MIRTILAGIGAGTLLTLAGLAVIVAIDVWRHRKGCRPTALSQQAPEPGEARTAARVGRPDPSMVFPETATTIDELLSDLATEGQMLLERERQL